MARINPNIAEDFIRAQENLPELLKAYDLSVSWVARRSNIPKSTFFKKLRDRSFTGEEFSRVIHALNN